MTTVLVVDDSPMDQKLAGACVEQFDCTPVYAANGREALEMIEEELPDVVLTDLQMPEVDGLELVGELRMNHPNLPVILMTAYGSEELAVKALQAGAASYVPKTTLKRTLGEALRSVLSTLDAAQQRDQARGLLDHSEAHFVLRYEPDGIQALISYLQEDLKRLNFCDEAELAQVSTALTEAITNAVDHGNLELDSELRESGDDAYRELARQRSTQSPYLSRRVFVTSKLTADEVTYIVRDEGSGFDPRTLPDPTDPENLMKASGRGVMLISTFMDDVHFNEVGNQITMVKKRKSNGAV